MSQDKPNIIVRLWRFIWRIVTWLRITLLNLFFIVFLVIVISAVMESAPKPIDKPGPLLLAPSGMLVDQLSYEAPLNALSGNNKPQETLTLSLIDTILFAANDNRITGLIFKLDDLAGGGISKIEEVGQAIKTFKATGKPVIAYGNSFGQQQYLLASYADKIYMHDMGLVSITGLGLYRNYFKTLINKLGINVHVFKSGTFKDFVEPYTRTNMSAASRAHNQEWVEALWQYYSENIEHRRNLEKGALDSYTHNIAELMTLHEGNTAALALDYKLVDSINSKQGIINTLAQQFGTAKNNSNLFHYINQFDYQQELFIKNMQRKGNIGLIVAAGTIMDGEQPEGTIGGDTLVHLLRKARDNNDLGAVIIRVDSGGGSAFASELIRQEIEEVRNAGKPVFISMGSMAASGGYWLATGADEIWATPSTLTGSIGVFSIIPTFEKSLDKIGVNNDGFATSDLAGLFRLERDMTPQAKAVFQMGVESTYSKFLKLCANSRDMPVEEIREIAEGRVWLGNQAMNLNLVDHLGSLQDTTAALAQYAKIDNPSIISIERDLTPFEQIVKSIMQTTQAVLPNDWLPTSNTRDLISHSQSLFDNHPMISILTNQLKQPASNHVYALCAECETH